MKSASKNPTQTFVLPTGDGESVGLWGPGSTLGAYRVERWLGQGGMGAVYEAVDVLDGARVALKVLRRTGPRFTRQLKREFRRIAAVRHPNLVELYELHASGQVWFFTMELLKGEPLLGYIWGGATEYPGYGPALDARLRPCLSELSLALDALHTEGLLHLDVKPSNILVADDGRLRLFDFGLVSELDERTLNANAALAGTPAYMAPEALAGEAVGPATDWFSFGVILYEALTGEKPFASDLDDRLHCPTPEVPAPAEVVSGVPGDLSELCMALLSPEASQRPNGEDARRVLSEPATAATRQGEPSADVFVGRDEALAKLERHLERAARGVPGWVEIDGEAGIGKSVLLGRFAARARKAGALVFLGRCFERETVPYPGFDEIAEGIADYVHSLEPEEQQALQSDLARAALLLPVLFEAPLATEPRGTDERTQGTRALKRILSTLSRKRALVLLLDDLQWASGDSSALLRELITKPCPENLLVVTAGTRGGAAPFAENSLLALSRPEQLRPAPIRLERLREDSSRDMVVRLAPGLDQAQVSAIVSEAAGSPRLLEMLSSHAHAHGAVASLDQGVTASLARFSERERAALELLALFEHPMPQGLWFRAVGLGAERPRVLAMFRHAGLIRTTGARAHDVAAIDHPAISKTLLSTLSEERRDELLTGLGLVLESTTSTEPSLLARHAELMGRFDDAARYAEQAGALALRTLAFSQAARWYLCSYEWTTDRAARLRLLALRATALEHAGHCSDAARVYETLLALEPERSVRYATSAAQASFAAGEIGRGLSILSPTLAELGIPHPESTLRLVMGLAEEAARLSLRGVSYTPRPVSESEPEIDDRSPSAVLADLTWTVGKGISVVMPMHGLLFHLRSLRAALEDGEPRRITRVLALLGAHLSAVGGPFARLGKSFSLRAMVAAVAHEDAYMRGLCLVCAALSENVLRGRPERVLELAREGLVELDRSGRPVPWEKDIALGLALIAETDLGHFEECARAAGQSFSDALARGDLYAQALARGTLSVCAHAQGRWDEALELIQLIESWTDVGFTMLHYFAARLRILLALSTSDCERAERELEAHWPAFVRAQLLRQQNPGHDIRFLRGLVTVERARTEHVSARSLRAVRDIAKKLEQSDRHVYRGHGALLDAALDAKSLSASALDQRLATAERAYDIAGQEVLARCVAFRRAALSGLPSGRAACERWFRERSVPDPAAFVAAHVPSFG